MYKKENLGLVPFSNKRLKVADSAMVGVGSRVRQPLSNSNMGPTLAPVADLNPGPDASTIDFNSREDVEMLLNEKMKGKNKNDYKIEAVSQKRFQRRGRDDGSSSSSTLKSLGMQKKGKGLVCDAKEQQVCRDPRWKCCYESYSEDPKIVQAMTQIIPSLQGEIPSTSHKGFPFVDGRSSSSCFR